jgi:hypothetical protein
MKFNQLPSIKEFSDLSRGLQALSALPRSHFQEMIENATRMADIYRNVDSMTKMLASFRTSTDISHQLLRSFELPKDSFHSIIEASSRLAAVGNNLSSLALAASRLEVANLNLIGLKAAAASLNPISKAIESALTARQVWQSAGIASLASRISHEVEFRQAFMDRLESENLKAVRAADSEIPTEQILKAIETGIEESGLAQNSQDVQASLNRLFSGWAKLPPTLQNAVVQLIIGILLLTINHSIFEKLNPSLQITINQRVKIVQQITNNITINIGATAEDRRHIRIVSKDDLPVFRYNRRDSEKVATLSAGQVVIVKQKNRNWTQVQWRDNDTRENCTGWVFTRYLKKI